MIRLRATCLLAGCVLLGSTGVGHPAHADVAAEQQSVPRAPTLAESIDQIHVRDGFKVELVASEPLVKDPVAIDWGSDGKLWVVEMADYPLGTDGEGKPGGRVRVLADTDQDGRYDTATLFAAGLPFPTGILVWGNGVLVTAAPEIVYLQDTDGDGRSDQRQVLFSGFLEGNQQLRVNGLRYGLDNWVHCASGSHHAGYGKDNRITSQRAGSSTPIGSRDFRFRPDDGQIEALSGPSQYGRNRDDWGNWFGVQNSHPLWHYVLDDRYLRRNPHFAAPDPRRQIVTPSNPKVYPAKSPQKRFHSFQQSGRFTSACSAMIYRDELLFGTGEHQHAFTCEPFHNLVQHNLILDDGVSFRSHRDPAEELDFFASEDRWCRPVMARTGPDGALWIVDMYRYMIEHPQWLPQEGKDELRPYYRFGEDQGRIYRILPSDSDASAGTWLEDHSPAQLVEVLAETNGWKRDRAQQLLVEMNDKTTIKPLKRMVNRASDPRSRLHALCTLDGMRELDSGLLELALRDRHPAVRRHAIRLSERTSVEMSHLQKLVDDPSEKVRLQLACTLGDYDDPRSGIALATLMRSAGGNAYLSAAVTSSINADNLPSLIDSVISSSQDEPILPRLVSQVAAMGEANTIVKVLEIATESEEGNHQPWQLEMMVELLDGLEKRKWKIDEHLASADKARIDKMIVWAQTALVDADVPDLTRAAAVGLLLRREETVTADLDLMGELLSPQSPSVVQTAIVARVSMRREERIAELLLSGWDAHLPQLRVDILSVLASRPAWVEVLVGHLESGAVSAGAVDAPMRERLLSTKNAAIRSRLAGAFAGASDASREQILEEYSSSLELSGDATRGEIVFRKLCLNCHGHGTGGKEVGPNLASVTNKKPSVLLSSIIDPSAAVESKYLNYLAITDDGRSLSGMIKTETGSSITLLTAEGKQQPLLRSEIESLKSAGKSLMPDGLEQGLGHQDVADLIEYVGQIGE